MRWARLYMSPALVSVGISLLLVFAGLTTALAPTLDASVRRPSDREKARPRTALEKEGRRIYAREGCWYCHTQQVRPVKADANLGPVSLPGDYAYDKPALLGSERQGPDLAWVGDRLPDIAYHIAHLRNPRSTMPLSIMPSYDHLPDHELRALAAYLVSLKSGTLPEKQMRQRRRHAHAYPPPAYRLQNPVNATREHIAAGRRFYERHCAACHGNDGRGAAQGTSAPAGGRLRPAVPVREAVDFTDGHYMGEASDAYLYWRISEGTPRAGPGHAFKGRLSPRARWEIVHYLRTFSEGSASE